MLTIYLFSYFAIFVFIALVILKIFKYAKLPVHLRWELYPVAHEPGKNEYGGSYYEEVDWWKEKQKKSFKAEAAAMLEEIFLLKGVFIHNKKLWIYSYPFHIGLYLVSATFILIFISAVYQLNTGVEITNNQNLAVNVLTQLTTIVGYSGLAFTVIGSIGLIVRRATDDRYKFYNTPMDFLNLIFILILSIGLSVTFIFSNASFEASRQYMYNMLSFNFAPIHDISFIVHLILLSLFMIYFPATKMMHMFAKYFTYHDVRWDDEPNRRGSMLEKKITAALNFGVSWNAPHMKTGKNWAEVATNFPPEAKNE